MSCWVPSGSLHGYRLAPVACRDLFMWHAELPGKETSFLSDHISPGRVQGSRKTQQRSISGLFAVLCNFRACSSQQVGCEIDRRFGLRFWGWRNWTDRIPFSPQSKTAVYNGREIGTFGRKIILSSYLFFLLVGYGHLLCIIILLIDACWWLLLSLFLLILLPLWLFLLLVEV